MSKHSSLQSNFNTSLPTDYQTSVKQQSTCRRDLMRTTVLSQQTNGLFELPHQAMPFAFAKSPRKNPQNFEEAAAARLCLRETCRRLLDSTAADQTFVETQLEKIRLELCQLDNDFAFLEVKILSMVKNIVAEVKQAAVSELNSKYHFGEQMLNSFKSKTLILSSLEFLPSPDNSDEALLLIKAKSMFDQSAKLFESDSINLSHLGPLNVDQKLAQFLNGGGACANSIRDTLKSQMGIVNDCAIQDKLDQLRTATTTLANFRQQISDLITPTVSLSNQNSPHLSKKLEQTLANSHICSLDSPTIEEPPNQTTTPKRESFDLLTNIGQYLPESNSIIFEKAFNDEEVTPIQFTKYGSGGQLFSLHSSHKREYVSPSMEGTSQLDLPSKNSEKIKEFNGATKTPREERLQRAFQKILASNEISNFDLKMSHVSKKNLLSSKQKNKAENELPSRETKLPFNPKLAKSGLVPKPRESAISTTKPVINPTQKPFGETKQIEKITHVKVFTHNSFNRYKPSITRENQATKQLRQSGLLERQSALQRDSNREFSVKPSKLTSLQEVCQLNNWTSEMNGPNSLTSNIYDKSVRRLNTKSQVSFKH